MKVYTGRSTGRAVAARFMEGSDLLDSINRLAAEAGFQSAAVQLIGAARRAVVQVFDQETKEYLTVNLPGPLEIASGTGNVSLREGKPFAHVHIVVSDKGGHCFGGHLAPGTEVYLAEVILQELGLDSIPERKMEPSSRIWAWS